MDKPYLATSPQVGGLGLRRTWTSPTDAAGGSLPSLAPRCLLRPGVPVAAGGAAEPRSWKQLGECSSKWMCWEGREEGSHLQQKDHQQDRTNPFTSTAKAQTTRPQPRAPVPAWQDPNWLRSFQPFRLLSVCAHQVPTKKLDQTKAPEGLRSSVLVACLKQPELTEWVSLGFSRDVRTISEMFRSQLSGEKADTSCTMACSEHPAQKHTTGGFPGGAATTARGPAGKRKLGR